MNTVARTEGHSRFDTKTDSSNAANRLLLSRSLLLVFCTYSTRIVPFDFIQYVYGDHIMDAKIAGENIVRDLYAAKGGPGLAYSVIRPGGLNDKPSVGSSKVHVSQGDVYSSEISREDVALVTVATLLKGTDTDFTTFELNQVEGLGKAMKSLPDLPAELVHTGANSFDGLVDGLLSDRTIKEKYPDLINSDFRGEGIPPIDTILSQYK
mmetsp:Transcript_6178/g.15511  ORF Transcript_6178/g.15511 Transcript_6178/m.15511 type:complete len:209 (-) Transcript_6178:2047-2673(-)